MSELGDITAVRRPGGPQEVCVTLLGPLSVRVGGTPVGIGSRAQRTVLALLVLARGREVSAAELAGALWGGRPPASARIRTALHVLALRAAFRAAGHRGPLVLGGSAGYRIPAEAVRADVGTFDALVAAAREAAGQGAFDAAGRLYRRALDLWHGPVAAGAEGDRLRARHLEVCTAWSGAELEAGRHRQLVPALTAAVRDHPLDEQLRHNLMLAQYRSGRPAEAAEEFRAWRRRCTAELGREPGPAVRALYYTVLRDVPSPAAKAEPGLAVRARAAAAQLPPDVLAFTGRGVELRSLDALVAERTGPRAPYGALVTGPAGVGKSGLAVHWAHRSAPAFPDGVLYADLAAHDDGPAAVHALMGRLLRALGTPVPEDPAGRATFYRATLARRRVLVLLDNAPDPSWVLPFLPGGGRSRVLVTSRRQADHTAVAQGAVLVDLGPLPGPEAAALVGRIAGEERCAAEQDAVRRLCALCDGLPLALRIAAGRLAARPEWSVGLLTGRLADERRRLDELSLGGLDLRTSLGRSYHRLPADAARAYRRLALLDTPDVTAWAAGVLLGMPVAAAEDLLERLAAVNLLTYAGTGTDGSERYRLPGLLRLYARERAETEDPAHDRQEARDRAGALLFGTRGGERREAVRALCRLAGAHARQERFTQAAAAYRQVLRLAREQGDPAGEAAALLGLGELAAADGHFDEADRRLRAALTAAATADDLALTARAHLALGRQCRTLHRTGPAARHLDAAVRAYRLLGSFPGELAASEELALLDAEPSLDLVPRQATR
ncbi:BTAD domain-containing putative transcriptional regulator [Streptoverticillium reticulum]|uniref:AfsR/SARP family transcriptional regulator n=1 Tax=Streptoverticillium reticulum TaxID=1433415 RepID=UPI0039BFB1FB